MRLSNPLRFLGLVQTFILMNHILLAGDARKSDHVGMPDTIKASSYIDVHCNYFRFFLDGINQGLSENEVIPCYTPQMANDNHGIGEMFGNGDLPGVILFVTS